MVTVAEPGDDLQQTISTLVRMLMARDRLNQTRLGERLGIDQTTVSVKLRGVNRWTVEDVRRLATVFNVHPGIFYGDPKDFTPRLATIPSRDRYRRQSTGWLTAAALARPPLAA